MQSELTTLELCAGAGGEALGLEQAGIDHAGLIDIDKHACETLRLNRPKWKVLEQDLLKFTDASAFKGVDIVSGGLPCPPFSKAGKQLGHLDERNLFPVAIDIIDQLRPRAVMIENVRGILDAVFEDYRKNIKKQLKALGYKVDWKLLQASDFGVPQLRPRVIFVALQGAGMDRFTWPDAHKVKAKTVGETLYDLMAANAWQGAKLWKERADEIAPTVVGGSKKHGGPDLGPTRAKRAWASLSVNGHTIADTAPEPDFVGMPRLTVPMVARIQGFPDDWKFSGKKTNAYRQVGNAFPPPVAKAVAKQLAEVLTAGGQLFQVAG
ncbi:MAG: DNA cytosine methyltransferase [Acidobacteriota bacterium]|nr:DNA cytosine methyltransferase [Acidobacteriota bacterium]